MHIIVWALITTHFTNTREATPFHWIFIYDDFAGVFAQFYTFFVVWIQNLYFFVFFLFLSYVLPINKYWFWKFICLFFLFVVVGFVVLMMMLLFYNLFYMFETFTHILYKFVFICIYDWFGRIRISRLPITHQLNQNRMTFQLRKFGWGSFGFLFYFRTHSSMTLLTSINFSPRVVNKNIDALDWSLLKRRHNKIFIMYSNVYKLLYTLK